jgi:hypothetical protein
MTSVAAIGTPTKNSLVALAAGPAGARSAAIYHMRYTYANTYATNGDPCDILAAINAVAPNAVTKIVAVILPNLDDTNLVIPRYDATNKKMLAIVQNSSDVFVEAGNSDLSAATFLFDVIAY